MNVSIRRFGNSKVLVLPEKLLVEAGLNECSKANIFLTNDAIVICKIGQSPRQGWADAARKIATQVESDLLMGEFDNLSG